MDYVPDEKTIDEFQDCFGFKEDAKNVVDNYLMKMESPNVFGIYGSWGSGKTSLMHYMKNYLIKEKKVPKDQVIWFDPFKSCNSFI